MQTVQPGILAPAPRLARYLKFSLEPDQDPRPCLEQLKRLADGERMVVGLGASTVAAVGAQIDGLFRFTQPISGSYYWCPPVKDGGLDLSALGL